MAAGVYGQTCSCRFFVFNAAPVLDGLRCAMFNIQENQEEVV
jgi:hypothetical protein